MKHLELEQQIEFCNKHGISFNELLLLEIILVAQENDDTAIVNKYFSSKPAIKGNIREMLIHMQLVGIVNKSFKIPEKGSNLSLFDIQLNKNIVKDFYKCSFELGSELFEAYPLSTVVNSVEYKLRRISKKFDSLEDAYRAYGKAIGWNPEKHNRIIELVKQGINNGYQFTNLGDFIVDRDWVNMEALCTDGILNNSNMTLL